MEDLTIRKAENGFIVTIDDDFQYVATTDRDAIDIVTQHFFGGVLDIVKVEDEPQTETQQADPVSAQESRLKDLEFVDQVLYGGVEQPVTIALRAEVAENEAPITREEALKTADTHADPEFDGVAKTEDIKPIAGDVYKRYVETPFIPLRDPVADTRVLAEQAKTNGIDEDAST
jgi:hypothetical protein